MELTSLLDTLLETKDIIYLSILLIFMILYSIFSLMLYIQINALLRYVDQISFSPILRFIAIANIVAAFVIIGYTILTITL